MKTRFDDSKYWRTARGEMIAITDMETSHIMNTVRMLIQKPNMVITMLVTDIDKASEKITDNSIWTPGKSGERDIVKMSMHNITSMKEVDVHDYLSKSPLFGAMLVELINRGVNTDNMIEMWFHENDVELTNGKRTKRKGTESNE